jgi:hypothetical protein
VWWQDNRTGQNVCPEPKRVLFAKRTFFAIALQASVEIPGLQLSNQDYFPYVYFHIDLSLLD